MKYRQDRFRPLTVVVALLVVVGPLVGGLAIGSESALAATASGTVEGTPHITASAPNARFDPGQSGTVDVTLSNNATYDDRGDNPPEGARDRAGEAQSVSVSLSEADAPLTVETGEQSVGTIADGASSGPHSFNVVVDEDASAGTYQLNVTSEYVHYQTVNYTQDADGDYVYSPQNRTTRTETDTITVVVEPEANFEVESVDHDVPLGGEGMVTLQIANTGDENVTEATVTVTSQDSDFYFGAGTASSEANVGPWNASVERTLRFRAGTADSAVAREYPIDVSVDYTDSDGASASDSTQIGITPGNRDHFAVRGVDHDVPENGEGTLAVGVEQISNRTLQEVRVTASTEATDVYLGAEGSRSSSTVVETWDPDSQRELLFRVGTTADAVDRSYPIDLEFEYVDANESQNSQEETVEFTPGERSVFAIEDVDHDVPRGGEGTLSIELEHQGGKSFQDVEITASTADSAVYLGEQGSASATTMVGEWDRFEDRTATFRVGTTDGAVERPYELEVTIDYTDDANNDNTRTKYVEFTPAADDHLGVELVSHDVPRDGVGPIRVEIENTAEKQFDDLAVTASTTDSEIYVGSESSRSGTASVEELAPDESRMLTFQVGATQNAVNRTYPLDLSIEYTDDDENQNQQSEQVAFRPHPEPQFRIESVSHDVPVGSTGRVTFTIRNDGPVNATETVVTASSEADAMFFGTGGSEPVEVQGVAVEPPQTGTPTAQTHVGNWSVGETRTVSFRAGFDEDAIVREYVANLAIEYENERGDEMPERSRAVGLSPLPEQQFDVEPVESDLHVGETGDLVVTVTNTVDRPVHGVVLTTKTQLENVDFYNARHAVGTLDPGESAHGRFRVGVTAEAESGPRVFEVTTRYRDPRGDVRQTDSQDLQVTLEPERDAFDLEVANTTFEPGGSGPYAVTVTNRRDERLSDIQARLFTDDPLDSADDSAYIESLDPGESATISFDLSVDGSGREKNYSAAMDFRFENAHGDTELSDTQRVPVRVRQSDDGVGSIAGIGFGIVFVVVGVVGWRNDALEQVREWYREHVEF